MIEIVDPTRLRASLQCLRAYYWNFERNRIPVAPRLPLIYGSGAHASLEVHYAGGSLGAALAAFEEVWEAEVTPYEADQMAEPDPKRNPVRWSEQLVMYRQKYAVEPFSVVGKPEMPFFLPLTTDLALGGVIDLVINYLNRVMVMDHKTTSVMWQSYFDSFNPNHQFSAYLYAASRLLDRPVDTMLVNCILVSANETSPEKMFVRHPTTRSPEQLRLFEEEFVCWWNDVVRTCRRTGNWPRNDDRCQRWRGGCAYHQLCTDITADYRKLIPSKAAFKEYVWDPVKTLRQHGLDPGV